MAKLFLDTGFAIALSSQRDQYHSHAVQLAGQIRAANSTLVTTLPVILEIGNSLAKQQFRQAAVQLIESMQSDPKVEIVPLDESLFQQSLKLFAQREDKDWSLTDCISFVVMEDQQITDALTPDLHFVQAGFRALLVT